MQRPINTDITQVLNSFDSTLKKRALRDAVLCIAWMKLLSIICYTLLFFGIHYNSSGKTSQVLEILVSVFIPFQILNGTLLFLGALQEIIFALNLSLWVCLALASYNTVMGVMGSVYFIRTGYVTIHFVLALIFALLAMSLFTVMCHDIIIVYAYKEILRSPNILDPQEPPRRIETSS